MSDNSETQKNNLTLPTFIMMLLDVADLIFEKMDPMDLLTIRKVSRDLRTAVDKFGIRFDEIKFRAHGEYISLYFDETKIRYSKNEDGDTTVTHKGQEIVIENGNFVEMALNDMVTVIKSNYVVLSLYKENSYYDFNVLTTIIAWLESEKCVLIDQIGLLDFTFDEVLTILPYLDAKGLQVIYLICEGQIDQFERITHLDQWTDDIRFVLRNSQFNIDQIELLFHIESFKITVDEFSVQNAIKIRDDLMKKSTFNSCEITFDASKINREDIANVFDSNSTRSRPWRFKYSNNQDSFWIRITVDGEDMEYTLCVNRIESSMLQQNNMILPSSSLLPLDVDLVAQKLEHMDRNSPQKSNDCSKMQLNIPFQPSLLNIPLDVADLVFEKMTLMDLLKTRKVCRGFKAAVDHFGVRFDRIGFAMHDNHIEMNLDVKYRITYNDADSGGTTVVHKGRNTVIENGNFLEMALNDLKIVLKCAPSLIIYNETRERDDTIITCFLDFLEKEECVHVKTIHFEWFSYDDIVAILPYCNTQTLEEISVSSFHGFSDEMKALINSNQWKMAKRFKFYGRLFENDFLKHLFHFEEFVIYHPFSVQDAIQIRDDLMRRSTFKKCCIKFLISETTEVFEIAKVFKPDVDPTGDYNFDYSNEKRRFNIDIEDSFFFSLTVKRTIF